MDLPGTAPDLEAASTPSRDGSTGLLGVRLIPQPRTRSTDDSIGGHHGPWARVIVRQSGTYLVESFETPFHRGSVRLAEYGAGVGYYPAISLLRFGGGKVDGEVSNIIVRGYDDAPISLVYP